MRLVPGLGSVVLRMSTSAQNGAMIGTLVLPLMVVGLKEVMPELNEMLPL